MFTSIRLRSPPATEKALFFIVLEASGVENWRCLLLVNLVSLVTAWGELEIGNKILIFCGRCARVFVFSSGVLEGMNNCSTRKVVVWLAKGDSPHFHSWIFSADQFQSDVCLSQEEKALQAVLWESLWAGLWRINSLSGEDEHKWTVIIAVALTMSLRRAKNRNFALASTNCGRARWVN